MLKLDVLEQRPLNPLEFSVSKTVTHKWPVLHVPFIHEVRTGSDPGDLDQVAPQVHVQETHCLLTEIGEDTTHVPEPKIVSCARNEDTRELFIVNSAVMLDTVGKVTPMEICDSAQDMMLQELDESSDMQIREDFFEITIAHKDELHMEDDHRLNDPVSKTNDKAAGMEATGTGAVLQSEQSARVGNLPNDPTRDESSGLEVSDSVKGLTELHSLAATETHVSTNESPAEFLVNECLQSTAYDTRDGDSVKCLEVEQLPCIQSPSTQRTFDPVDLPKVPISCHETLICKEPGFSCKNEIGSTTCSLERLAPNATNDIMVYASPENVPSDKDLDMSVGSVRQEIDTTSSDEKQNDISDTYLSTSSSAAAVSTTLQDVQSDTLKDELLSYDKSMTENDSISPGILKDEPSFELIGAKALDTEECLFSSSTSDCNTPVGDGAFDCHTKCTCANKDSQLHSSDPSPQEALCSAPLTSICEKPLHTKSPRSSYLMDHSETSFTGFNSHSRNSQLDGESKEHLFMSIAHSNGLKKNNSITDPELKFYSPSTQTEKNDSTVPQVMALHMSEGTEEPAASQSPDLYNAIPDVINYPNPSLKINEAFDCLVTTEDSTCEVSNSNAVIHDVLDCDKAVPSHLQSNIVVKLEENVLASRDLKVPCETKGYCTNKTQSYALVPYVDIWGFLFKPEVNSPLFLREPKNFSRRKMKFQNLKRQNCEFNSRASERHLFVKQPKISVKNISVLKTFDKPQDVVNSSHNGGVYRKNELVLDGSLAKMHTLLSQKVMFNVSANSIPCHGEYHSTEMRDKRISRVPHTTKQSKSIIPFSSGAVCDISVPLDVHNMSVLPPFVDIRHASDTPLSEQINVCFLKEKPTPHLSLSDQHFGDHSSSPASIVALTGSKKRHSEVFVGNLQSHSGNHACSSLRILDDPSQSLSLKQDAELGLRHTTLHKEPFKASDSVECIQTSAAEIYSLSQSVQANVSRKKRKPFMPHMENLLHERKPSPGKTIGAMKTKTTRIKSQRNVFNAEITFCKKSLNDCQLLKERPRQSAGCPIEMLSGTTENRKKYNLRPVPQSLNCSSQEAKRPKICNVKDISPNSSGLLNCGDKFPLKSESHQLSKARLPYKRKEPPSAIRNGFCLDAEHSVKRQSNRKCNSFSAQKNLQIKGETRTCKTSPVFKIDQSCDIDIKCKSLPSTLDSQLILKPHSKMTGRGVVSQKHTHFQQCSQDLVLLNKLSRIANRLTAQSKASCMSNTLSSNLKVIPFRGVKFQARKLLNVFSCVNMRMNCQPGQIWQENVCLTSNRDHLVSQSMNHYSTYFPKTYFSSIGNAFSLDTCDNLTFPVSFHVNIDPNCLTDFLKLNPPDFILRPPRATSQSSELSEWTLSLFLSSQMPEDSGNVHLLTQWNPQFRSLESSRTRKSVRKSGCSMLGLHTVLALSSPGCYRLWTRRRNLGSRIPAVQRHSVTQFAHGLKGSLPPFSRRGDQFSSLAFSLGRVLSTWSQHGLSAFSSECANTHPNCSVWLPNQSSNIMSVCRSPNPVVHVPQLPLNTIPQYRLPLQDLNLGLKTRVNHPEDVGLAFCLSTQQKAHPRTVCWLSSQCKNDVELSSCSLKQQGGSEHAFILSTVKEDNLNLQLDRSSQPITNLERPLGLCSLKLDLKPVVKISRCDVVIQEDASLDLPFPDSRSKGRACNFEQSESIIVPCTQSQGKDQGNEKGSFEGKPQRVSQIRIRKTVPKPDQNLTPMGLPKPKRVNKKEFSLEDIYTNKNYKSPPPARSLETIFEEPKEKNGVLISVSQQKRKRILEFRDCTVPRLKRPKGKVKVMTSCKRGRKAAMEGVQLDALLIQKLMDLENCLLEEETMERGSAALEGPS